MFNEEFENRKEAGRALVVASQKSQEIADRLFNLICAPVDAEIAASALSVMFFGWPTYSGLGTLIDQAKKSPLPALQVAATLCAIRSGAKEDDDLEALLPLADLRRYFYPSYGGDIVQALVEGWPNSDKLYDLAIRSARQRGGARELAGEIAKTYLLATSKMSAQRDKDLADVIRNDRFFFSHIGGSSFCLDNFGPKVMAAVDDHLVSLEKFQLNDIAHLAVTTKSARAKARLLELLYDPEQLNWIFWPVWGLLTGWGMHDAEVWAALEPLAEQPPDKVQFIAHHLNAIVPDGGRCREILLSVARLTNLQRLDFLASGFQRAGIKYTDEVVVEALLNHDLSRRGVFDATGDLIGGFGKHPKVRAVALARIKEIDAPWNALAIAYGDDGEFRRIIMSRLLSISAELRSSIAMKAGRNGNTDSGLCHRNRNQLAVTRQEGFLAQAAVAFLQVSNASPLRMRSALRDVR